MVVVRRAVLRRLARAAAAAGPRLPSSWRGRTGSARRASTGRRTSGQAVGAGVRRVGRRREAALAAPDGPLGHARSSAGPSAAAHHATGPGNSVPRFHITWGTGPGVVEPFERRVRAAAEAGRLELRFRHRVDALIVTDGAVDGVAGAVLEPSDAPRGTPSSRDSRRRVRAARAGGHRHLRRHRRQPRPGARSLAGAARHAACAHAVRRPRARRRADDRHRREGRRRGDQPGPDVALRRGDRQLGPGLAAARHPHPARAVLALAGRHRTAAARRRSTRGSTRSARWSTCGAPGTTTRWFILTEEDHRAGVRAVRLRAEPRPDRPGPEGHDHQPVRRRRCRGRCRPSSTTARTSSPPRRCPTW